ncbi:MAG: phage tail tube protein [Sneathiella sp.]
MGKKIGGTAYVKFDGKQVSLAGSITIQLDNVEREGVTGLSGVVGYNEKPIVPFVEGEFFMPEDMSMDEIRDITNATITVELANGKVGTLSQAWNKSANEVDGDSKFTTRFEGMKGEWQ